MIMHLCICPLVTKGSLARKAGGSTIRLLVAQQNTDGSVTKARQEAEIHKLVCAQVMEDQIVFFI